MTTDNKITIADLDGPQTVAELRAEVERLTWERDDARELAAARRDSITRLRAELDEANKRAASHRHRVERYVAAVKRALDELRTKGKKTAEATLDLMLIADGEP